MEKLTPFFLDSAQGKIFCLYFPPKQELKGAILYVPPFLEEMNRCRSTVAQQAKSFSELGFACLIMDYYGTGDSEGLLSEASWEVWINNVKDAATWLEAKTQHKLTLWGFRFGALMASKIAEGEPERFNNLLLWQPVLDGKTFLTQYLRIRVAFLMDRELPAETTKSIRENLANNKSVEIAGYELFPQLALDIDQIKMANLKNINSFQIDWYENVTEEEKPISVASKKIVSHLTELGNTVDVNTFLGPPIWQLHERDELPEIIRLTTEKFQGIQ